MNPNKTLFGLCILLLLVSAPSFALSEETSSVYSIAGESTTQMLKQMQINEENFNYTNNHFDIWTDYAGVGVKVNKQKGDKLTLNIYSEQDTSATISYNSAVFNGECPNGNLGINEGLNTCGLEVDDEASLGALKITVGSKTLDVEITDSSDLLIITDSEKLFERYPAESNGVKGSTAK